MTFDFLELFNAVGRSQKPVFDNYKPADSLDTEITPDNLNLDSLDVTLVTVILGEAYDIPQDLEPHWPTQTIRTIHDFIMEHKRRNPEDEYATIQDLVKDLS